MTSRTQYQTKPRLIGLIKEGLLVIDPNNYIVEAIGPFDTFAQLEKACNELEQDERTRRNDPTFTLEVTVCNVTVPL